MMDLNGDPKVREIVSRLAEARPGEGPVKVDGTWGSYARVLAGHIRRQLGRPIMYITAHQDEADNAADDLQNFAADARVSVFPVREDVGAEPTAEAGDEIAAERVRIALQLAHSGGGNGDWIVCAGIQAILQPVNDPQDLVRRALTLAAGQTIDPLEVVEWLPDGGFERVDQVDVPGQFAARGGIVDIYAAVTQTDRAEARGGPQPIRVEFFGDCVESIRRIDLDTQRSHEPLQRVCIFAFGGEARENTEKSGGGKSLIDLLPDETIVLMEEPLEIEEVAGVFLDRLDDSRGMFTFGQIYQAASRLRRAEIARFAAGGTAESIHVEVGSVQPFEHKAGAIWKDSREALEQLLAAKDRTIDLYCENAAQVQRIGEIVREIRGGMPEHLRLPIGFVHRGFVVGALGWMVISHHEIFGQSAVRRRIRSLQGVSVIHGLLDLQKGDIVVHVNYGIGKFLGIRTIEKDDQVQEYLTIEFADKVLIHVPAGSVHLVQKYIGTMVRRPPLSRVGSKKWQQQKQRVAQGVRELAEELLEIQAKRIQLGGTAFGPDTVWQKEFEESFAYEETADQLHAIEQIKGDLMRPVPMDRLLCGDVGYGKTELAMRAAFKAAESGKQVAILVPTTVLCVQHGRTFRERFAEFPVTVEVLNRFVTARDAAEIIRRTREGKVDILIGTHRILSDDVEFKDLGLLIIDEEQRFGVEHKERLKRFRVNVDVLTMTATPIPRTLHLSMLGLRDISSLATPPLDRRSIVTKVCRYDPDLIRKAIRFELAREGQVFFVHNRVQSIERAAEEIRQIIGDESVRIVIGHGQMHKSELENAMIEFVTGQAQILVCSTIIESGLDIPNANTMIIHDADKFGLAQLHQLRGRVGRYKHRAYAYMLLPKSRTIHPIAAKRLKAIEEYSQLGAGFRIALRDLEIRGAGNILGPEQSGHIHTVGYELYCQLLQETVQRLRNEPVLTPAAAAIDLGFAVHIPRKYIASDRQRLDVYRRVALATTTEDLRRIAEELKDLFGPPPEPVRMLLEIAEMRLAADKKKIKSISAMPPDLIFVFEAGAHAADVFAHSPGSVRIPDPQTVHVRLEKNYFEPQSLLMVLRKILLGRPGSKKSYKSG